MLLSRHALRATASFADAAVAPRSPRDRKLCRCCCRATLSARPQALPTLLSRHALRATASFADAAVAPMCLAPAAQHAHARGLLNRAAAAGDARAAGVPVPIRLAAGVNDVWEGKGRAEGRGLR
eukprot:363552-Chlamydomonas_euryale.AAC.1